VRRIPLISLLAALVLSGRNGRAGRPQPTAGDDRTVGHIQRPGFRPSRQHSVCGDLLRSLPPDGGVRRASAHRGPLAGHDGLHRDRPRVTSSPAGTPTCVRTSRPTSLSSRAPTRGRPGSRARGREKRTSSSSSGPARPSTRTTPPGASCSPLGTRSRSARSQSRRSSARRQTPRIRRDCSVRRSGPVRRSRPRHARLGGEMANTRW
jgi:hypothetical protein